MLHKYTYETYSPKKMGDCAFVNILEDGKIITNLSIPPPDISTIYPMSPRNHVLEHYKKLREDVDAKIAELIEQDYNRERNEMINMFQQKFLDIFEEKDKWLLQLIADKIINIVTKNLSS